MNEKNLEQLSNEEFDKLPPSLKMRLGYLKVMKEKQEQQKEEEQLTEEQLKEQQEKTPYELLKLGLEKQLKADEKDSLSD
ncbi:hypothetical protein QUF73_24865 [Cytobacillus sp. NJ13]|nr:hypothetical protein [Cytobacillus sp. NJ13]